ncbi:MAG: GspE/PulE family protein, partial [Planctomycetota bacterium]
DDAHEGDDAHERDDTHERATVMSTVPEGVDAAGDTAASGHRLGGLLEVSDCRVDPAWALKIPASLALRKSVLPMCELDGVVQVACCDVDDQIAAQAIRKATGREVRMIETDPGRLREVLTRIYGGISLPAGVTGPGAIRRGDAGDGDDAATICDEVLLAAVMREASDIHFLPTETSFRIRFRVDGALETYRELPKDAQGPVTSRIKVLSGLDIAEKRAPQDGRFNTRVGPNRRKLDLRVATLPTRFGERTTMRLLATASSSLTMERLGMDDRNIELFRGAINRPHGMILLTGPTGSGKSTSLYVALTELLARRGGNVITVEDPIEYEIEGASQVEVDGTDRVSFHRALRSILRHDPDVVMIGEIRDSETANIAVKASLTGHLVLSTLHTNTAVGVITRLADLGLERFLIAATVRMAIAQRLVRRLCPQCRKGREMTMTEALSLGRRDLAGQTIYDAVGCVYCAGRGYNGRVAMFEMLAIDQQLAEMIDDDAEESELLKVIRQAGTPGLLDDAVSKLLSGVTSLPEVLSNVVDF